MTPPLSASCLHVHSSHHIHIYIFHPSRHGQQLPLPLDFLLRWTWQPLPSPLLAAAETPSCSHIHSSSRLLLSIRAERSMHSPCSSREIHALSLLQPTQQLLLFIRAETQLFLSLTDTAALPLCSSQHTPLLTKQQPSAPSPCYSSNQLPLLAPADTHSSCSLPPKKLAEARESLRLSVFLPTREQEQP